MQSSAVYGNQHLRGADRVIDICRAEQASHYYNLPGGRDLYEGAAFASHGIDLCFIETKLAPYPQTTAAFQPGLSMLDVLMYNDVPSRRESDAVTATRWYICDGFVE